MLEDNYSNSFETIRTFADQTTPSEGCTEFSIEFLYNTDKFMIKNALVVSKFTDDESTFPHRVDTSRLEHFKGVEIQTVPHRSSFDILIGQSHKSLLVVLGERESVSPDETNYVLTRFGRIASDGRVPACSTAIQSFKVSLASSNNHVVDELKQEIASLKNNLREYELNDQMLMPSKTDELDVETNIKVVDNRYEIPAGLPLKYNMVGRLPNNYQYVLERTNS